MRRRTMMVMIVTCALALAGCTSDTATDDEQTNSVCSEQGHDLALDDGTQLCVYSSEIVIETGFECPTARPHLHQFEGREFAVCSGEENLGPGVVGEIEEKLDERGWDVGDRPDVVEDSGSDAEPDATGDVGEQVRSGWWGDVTNRCAEGIEPRVPEQLVPSALPADAPTPPTLVWQKPARCYFSYADEVIDGEDAGTPALASTGEGDEAVETVIAPFMMPHLLSSMTPAMAHIDPSSGETIGCDQLPTDVSVGLMVDSSLDRAWGGLAGNQGETDNPVLYGWRGWSLTEDAHFDASTTATEGSPDLFQTPEGLLVVRWNYERLFGVDPVTGEIFWTITPDDVLAGAQRFGSAYVVRGETGLLIEVDGAQFRIDDCGQGTVYGQAELPIARVGNYHIISGAGGTRAIAPDGAVHELPVECEPHVITLSNQRLACKVRSGNEVVSFDLDGSDLVRWQPAEPADAEQFSLHRMIVGGRNSHVIVTGSVRMMGGDEPSLRVYVVDMAQAPSTAAFVDVPPTQFGSGRGLPVVTSTGMVVGAWGDSYFGVQTDVGGLAEAPYPRGLRVGGNENRGFVDVP